MRLHVINYGHLYWSNASRDKPRHFVPLNEFNIYTEKGQGRDIKINWDIEKYAGQVKLQGEFNYAFYKGNFYFLEKMKSFGNGLHLYKVVYDFWCNEVVRKNISISGTLDKTSDMRVISNFIHTTKPLIENPNGRRVIPIDVNKEAFEPQIIATATALHDHQAYNEIFDPESLKTFKSALLSLKGQNTDGKEKTIPLALFTWHALTWKIHLMRQLIKWLHENRKSLKVYDLKTSQVGFVNNIAEQLKKESTRSNVEKFYAITTEENKIFADNQESALHIEKIDLSKFEGLDYVEWSSENFKPKTQQVAAEQMKTKTKIILKEQDFKDFQIQANTKPQYIDGLELSGVRIGEIKEESQYAENHVIKSDGKISILVGIKPEALVNETTESLKIKFTQENWKTQNLIYKEIDVKGGDMVLPVDKYLILKNGTSDLQFDPSRWRWSAKEWEDSLKGIFNGTPDTDDKINVSSFLGDNRWEKTAIVTIPDPQTKEYKLGFLSFKTIQTEGKSIDSFLRYAHIEALETSETESYYPTESNEVNESGHICDLLVYVFGIIRPYTGYRNLLLSSITAIMPESVYDKQDHVTYNQNSHAYSQPIYQDDKRNMNKTAASYSMDSSAIKDHYSAISGLVEKWGKGWGSQNKNNYFLVYVSFQTLGTLTQYILWRYYDSAWYPLVFTIEKDFGLKVAVAEVETISTTWYGSRSLSYTVVNANDQPTSYADTTLGGTSGIYNDLVSNFLKGDVDKFVQFLITAKSFYLDSHVSGNPFSNGTYRIDAADKRKHHQNKHAFHHYCLTKRTSDVKGWKKLQVEQRQRKYIKLDSTFNDFSFDKLNKIGLPKSLSSVEWWESSYISQDSDYIIFSFKGIHNMLLVVGKGSNSQPKFELLLKDSSDIVGSTEVQAMELKQSYDITNPIEIINQCNTLYAFGSMYPLKFRGALSGEQFKFPKFLIKGIKITEAQTIMDYRRLELDTGEDYIDTVITTMKKEQTHRDKDPIAWANLMLRVQEEQRLKNNDFIRLQQERRRHFEDVYLAEGELAESRRLVRGSWSIEDQQRNSQWWSNALSGVTGAAIGTVGAVAALGGTLATGGLGAIAAAGAIGGVGTKIGGLFHSNKQHTLQGQMIDLQRDKQMYDLALAGKRLSYQDQRWKEDFRLKRDDVQAQHALQEAALRHEIIRMNSSVNIVQATDTHIHEEYNKLLTESDKKVDVYLIQQFPSGKVLDALTDYYNEFGVEVLIPNFTFSLDSHNNILYRFVHVWDVSGVTCPIVRNELIKMMMGGVMIRSSR